jgi:hypothetical protein
MCVCWADAGDKAYKPIGNDILLVLSGQTTFTDDADMRDCPSRLPLAMTAATAGDLYISRRWHGCAFAATVDDVAADVLYIADWVGKPTAVLEAEAPTWLISRSPILFDGLGLLGGIGFYSTEDATYWFALVPKGYGLPIDNATWTRPSKPHNLETFLAVECAPRARPCEQGPAGPPGPSGRAPTPWRSPFPAPSPAQSAAPGRTGAPGVPGQSAAVIDVDELKAEVMTANSDAKDALSVATAGLVVGVVALALGIAVLILSIVACEQCRRTMHSGFVHA